MKKIIAIAFVALVAAAVQADVIYSEDFSATTFVYKQPIYYPSDIAYGVYGAGAVSRVYTTVAETLALKSVNPAGATPEMRGTSVVLDGAQFVNGETYTLSFDIVNIYTATTLEAQVWESSGAAAGNSFFADNVGPTTESSSLGVGALSTATVNKLAGDTYVDGEEAVDVSFTFSYTGSDQIVLLFSNNSGALWADKLSLIDNVQIVGTAIPEPGTGLLFGIGGIGAWIVRRNRQKAQEETDA